MNWRAGFAAILITVNSPALSFLLSRPPVFGKVLAEWMRHGPGRGHVLQDVQLVALKVDQHAPVRHGFHALPAENDDAGPQQPVAAAAAAAAISGSGGAAMSASKEELVTLILRQIEGTNRGVDCTTDEREEIDALIEQLNTIGEGTDWLSDPQVFGNYNVAYVSSGSSEKSNPAGGRWRGKLGRSLFRTDEMYQHLVAPATAVNMVVFRAFGLISGCVTLRGEFEAIQDRPNFVRAAFGPPLINILGERGLTLRSGPKSSVALAATYVDERIRLGKGGRGSLFVFTRGGSAATPAADMWEVYAKTSSKPMKAKALGVASAGGAVVAAIRSAYVPAGVLALVSVALIATRGGIEGNSSEADESVQSRA